MADLYISKGGYIQNNEVPKLTGNEKVDSYLNTLPSEERADAIKKITAPMTGEEVAQRLHEDTDFKYTPTIEQFKSFSDYQAKKETSIVEGLDLFSKAVGGIYDIAGNVISSIYDHPLEDAVKLAPSLLEGGTQNIRNWYGMIAQSQDPNSVLFKWKNTLARDGSPEAYRQFLEARNFAKESVDYETGKKTILVNKDYIDPALTQAATIIVDPMFYGSFLVGAGEVGIAEKVAQILGMSERLAKASAFAEKMKGAVYGGALKYGIGVPLEFIGDITRGTIDKTLEVGSNVLEGATGISAQELKQAAKVGGFGSIAAGVPYVSPTSKVYLGAGFAGRLGEALGATGEQIMKNGGKRGLLSFAEQAMAESDAMLAKGGSGLTPQARKILNVINKVDPMFSYAGAFMEGGVHGAVFGAGLGYLGGGSEGAYSGAGAGFGIGSLGGLAGRAMSNIGGGLEKQRLAVQMEMLMPMLKDVDPTTHSSMELLRMANRAAGNPDWVVDRYIVALDKIAPETKFRTGGAKENEAQLRAKGQDPAKYDGYEHETTDAFEPKPKFDNGRTPSTIERKISYAAKTFGYLPESIKKSILLGDYSSFKNHIEKLGGSELKNLSDSQIKELAHKIILSEDAHKTELKRTKVSELSSDEIDTYNKLLAGEKTGELKVGTAEKWKQDTLARIEKYKNSPHFGEDEYAKKHQEIIHTENNLGLLRETEPASREKALKNIKDSGVSDSVYNETLRKAKEEGLVNSQGKGEAEAGGIKYKLDKDGNKIRLRDAEGHTIPTMQEFDSAGWTIREDANGKIKVHINTDKLGDLANTLPHEMFHAVFRELGMKSEFKDRINEHILGTFDANGKQIKPPSISKYEAESFFTKYINNAYTGNDKTERLAKLKQALDEYYKTGQMTVMEADGKTPVLHNLTEEFGAYYWTQFLNDKPVDYLFRGGDLGGVRNALDSVKNKWQDYMERKVGGVNGGFDFARSQYLNPSFLDANGKRIRVSALDYMMQDLIRTKSAASKGQAFDFNNLSPEGQRAYVEASGNSVAFEPPAVKGGKYKVRSEAQQAKIRAKNSEAMHKGLEAFRTSNPDILRIKDAQGNDVGGLSVDADGNYVGTVPDAILDYFVKSGHIDKVEAERIKILQKAARGETPSNVFEFTDYTGDTMHTGVGADIRAVSPNVPTKSRLVIVTDFSAKISPKDYGFYPHTLDYRHLELRVDNSWKDPKVRAAWGDDRDAFVSDLFRYFKNASLPDGQRLPSAQLWAENGEYKRNIMHDVSGVQTPAAGTINTANAPIAGDMFSTFRKFRTDRMTQERMSGEKIDLRGDNAIDYIRHNMMPSEMSGETTPNGKIWTHPSGYKFLQVQGGIKAVKPDGTIIGKFTSMEEAVKRADVIYQKENPNSKPIASVDNIRNEPADAPETQAQYAQRKIDSFYERPENALDLLNSKEFENFFEKKGAFTLDRLKVAIKNIIDDANKPNQGDRFATDFIDYPIEGDYILEEYLSQDFPKAKTIGDVFKEYFKDQYFREQEANNPTFVSGLSVALDKIIPANVNKEGTIQASRLLNQMKNASGGDIGKILTESNAIGFTDWLKSKGQTRVSETEIRQYIQDNGIKVSIDPRTDIRGNEWMGGGFDTSRYVAEGKKDGYYTFVARINPEQAHGVEGHFGGDTIAHIRATIRTDAQGRKVLFIEEIQSINTHAGVLTPEARVKAIEEYRQLKKWDEASTNFKEEVAGVRAKYKEKISEGAKELRESFSSVISETPEQEKARSKYYRDRLFKLYAEKINDYRKVWEIYKDKIEPKFKEKVEKEIKIRKKRYGSSLERDITLDFFYNFDSELSHGKILNFSDYTRKISEVESRLAKKKSDKPLQDFNETVKIASRTIMRKAVELGADRVVLVRPEDMHPDVSKNAEGERFVDAAYGRDIPMMMDAELKKYGQKLEPARNYNLSKELNVPFSERENNQTRTTKAILSESLGYDITPEMKQKAGRSQTFMMPSEGEQGGRKYSSKELKGSFIGKQAQEKPELTDGIKLSYRSWDTEEGATEGRKLIILTRSSDGAEIGRIDFDYTNLTKHGMKSRGFGDKDGIVVDGISVNVNKRFQGKGYQHILYSEMYERARAMGATGFSQEIENAKGLPLKSVNKVIGESNHSIASLSEPTAQKPTQENFNRLIENAPAIESNYHSNLPSVQNWGKIDPNARYMPAEENVNYKGKQLKIVEPSETELRNAGTGTFSGGYYTERKNLNINNIAPATTINLNSSEQSKIYNIVKSIKSSNGHIERLIVDKDGKIIEGGHRYLALKQLGITNVPVVQLIEKSSLLKNYNSILSEFSNVSNLHPEQSRQMLEHAVDIIKEDGISGLDNSEMPKPFEQNWNKLKDIIKSKEVSTDTKNMMPAEGEYRSGDNYWKAKDNKFEGVDENGQTYRLAYAVVNGKTEYHPDFVSWLDIGHGSGNSKDIKRFGLWGENPTNIKENGKFNKDEIITKPLGNNFVGDHQNWFEKEFKYTEEEPKTMGRYELPVYDSKGKLVTRGRISITDKELQRSMSSFKSIKERVCKKLKIKSEDVDAYIFGGRIQANEELGISHKDQLPIKFMPAEGKQSKKTYTDTEFKGSLIGAYAKEHEFLTKDLNINVELSKPAKDYNYLYVHLSKENGDNVGGMAVHIYPDREMAKVYNTSIKPDYQGRGYGNLLYSEVFERLRSLGIKSVKGEMADKQGRPAMIRKSVAGKTTVSSSGLLNTELKSNRNYMPAEQAEAWRKFQSEKVSDDNSIFKNAMNYVIIQANNKYKVYNPQKALLGIYTDLDQAKRRVQREEPKPR